MFRAEAFWMMLRLPQSKTTASTDLPIETEADVFREAIAHLEQIMDRAIAEARQADSN
jgi:hypothetical protein